MQKYCHDKSMDTLILHIENTSFLINQKRNDIQMGSKLNPQD